MRKVGILTLFYKTDNYGSQLQAFALQHAIEKMGYDCEQIRFVWKSERTRDYYEEANVKQEVLESFSYKIPHSQRIYTPKDLAESVDEYDIFISGSDQVWGRRNSIPIYVLPLFLLSFVRGKKKIAYGASFGSANISEKSKEVIRNFLDGFDFISMREPSAVSIVKKMTEKQVVSVVDPVMLLSAEEWRAIATLGERTVSETGYVLVYTESGRKEILDKATEFARQRNLGLVDPAYNAGKAVDTYDFIYLVDHAAYIITDSFYGSVLSVVFHKQFITLGIDLIPTGFSQNVSAMDILEICGLSERFIFEAEDWYLVLERTIDYESVEQKLAKAKRFSKRFLEMALTSEEIFAKGVNKPERGAKYQKEGLVSKSNLSLLYNKIVNVGKCTGCGACVKCPISCINMVQDELGFWQPKFRWESCINCGQCLHHCPVYHLECERKTDNRYETTKNNEIDFLPKTLALQAKQNEILMESASGGAFSVVAERFLANGGVVCGAVYDKENDFLVKHICIELPEQLSELKKSKYMQSNLGQCFSQIEQYLKDGRLVLFSGTPCQVAGLKRYLGGEWKRLYTIDLICGGVTSPLLWKKYVDFYRSRIIEETPGAELDINFDMRSKEKGFFQDDGMLAFAMTHKRNGDVYLYEKKEDLFLASRFSFYGESCYQCMFKGNRHDSDLTLGDFVGLNKIAPWESDNRGSSLVLIRTEKGKELLKQCKETYDVYNHTYKEACAYNKMIEERISRPLGTDYLRGIAPFSSIERLYYETERIRVYQDEERIFRNFMTELKRNELLMKVKKYLEFQCKSDFDSLICGDIVIYGAGKLGRALAENMVKKLLCFLDRANKFQNVLGYPVYQLESEEFAELYHERQLTVLVTPVWDYWEIYENLKEKYPKLHIVSLEKIVKKIRV